MRITFHFSETKSVVLNLTTWIDYFLFSFQILFIMRTRSQKHLVDHHEADEAVPSDNTPAPLLNMDKEHEEQMINNFRSEKEREQEQKNEKVQEKKVNELDTVGAVTSQVEIVVAYSHFFSPKTILSPNRTIFSLFNRTIFQEREQEVQEKKDDELDALEAVTEHVVASETVETESTPKLQSSSPQVVIVVAYLHFFSKTILSPIRTFFSLLNRTIFQERVQEQEKNKKVQEKKDDELDALEAVTERVVAFETVETESTPKLQSSSPQVEIIFAYSHFFPKTA